MNSNRGNRINIGNSSVSSNGNPFGEYRSRTQQMNIYQQNEMNNYNNAYRQVEQPFVEQTDFLNRHNVLHDNLGETLMSENIVDITLFLDGRDRSITAFPNPFKFTVSFNAASSRNGGTPEPVIARSFKNVKSIKLDYMVLPKSYKAIRALDGTYTIDNSFNLNSSKYIILKIKEIDSPKHVFSTSNRIDDTTFILCPDRSLGTDHQLWIVIAGPRNFQNSLLGDINRMTIEVYDSDNNLLTPVDQDGNIIDFSLIYSNIVPIDVRESLEELNKELCINVSLTLSIVENEMNTNTKFSR